MSNRDFHSTGTGMAFNGPAESTGWKLERFVVEKFWVDPDTGRVPDGAEPYEVVEGAGNLLTYGGAGAMWQLWIGGSITPYDNANAWLGVGDSTDDADRTQTDLQASTNKSMMPMDATYPLHTDSTTSAASSIIYKATYGTSEANFDWNEWGLFNASAGGRMANRKVEYLGTKTSSSEWTLTIVIGLS